MPPSHQDADQLRWFMQEVQPHEATLRAYLRRQFPKLTDVDDVVQESYLRLIQARLRGRLRSVRGLLFTTARNAALDVFRRRHTSSQADSALAIAGQVADLSLGVAEAASLSQELALLAEAVESLPQRCREILKLRKIYGLSHREIARRLHISERTVNVQVGNGVRRCAEFLRAHGVTIPPQ